MSRHEGVSCDSCLIGNFRGKRYKCLICYDYDLCATCYEAGAATTRHTPEHPMQCILTRSDFDLYYGGEAVSLEQPQSFTCPFCGKMGFTESTLQEHVSGEHTDSSVEVVCPVCAALPGGDPNHVTEDFAGHLSMEHRTPRDLEEPPGSRHVRRIPHPGRGVGGTRARRANMHFSTSGGLASLSPNNRESVDPIAELLSQLSGVRRSAAASQQSTTSQLQQLQMQLQLERQQFQAARQQLERLPRRQGQTSNCTGNSSAAVTAAASTVQPSVILESNGVSASGSGPTSQFLLARYTEPVLTENELQALEVDLVDHSVFVQELLLSALTESLSLDSNWEVPAASASSDKIAAQSQKRSGEDSTNSSSGSSNSNSNEKQPSQQQQQSPGNDTRDCSSVVQQEAPPSAGSGCGSGSGSGSGGGVLHSTATPHQAQTVANTQQSRASSASSSTSSSSTTSNVNVATKKMAASTQLPSSGAVGGGSASTAVNQKVQGTSSRQGGSGGTSSSSNVRPPATNNAGSTNTNVTTTTTTAAAPPPQRMAPSGTGTIREVPPQQQPQQQQQVVGGRMAPLRSGASPSASSRRKMVRHIDGRNQPNEPPPPH